jgi:hypothetical protein
MLRVALSWAAKVWALPFLTALCPSQRYHDSRGKRHKKLTDWARQMVQQVRRWLPGRQGVIVADSALPRCMRQRLSALLASAGARALKASGCPR